MEGRESSFRCFRERLRGQILSFKSYPHFRGISMPRDANRNSQRLSPFVKMVEKQGELLPVAVQVDLSLGCSLLLHFFGHMTSKADLEFWDCLGKVKLYPWSS